MAHTPGPWFWKHGVMGANEWQLEGNIKYSDLNPILIAFDCGCRVRGGKECPLSPTETDRNLIAAAPNLLTALELILPLAKGYANKNPVGGNWEYISLAEAALAKAQKEDL